MTELSSISREVASLGFKTKSIKAVSTPSGSDAEVSAKFEALKNDGSELIVKGDDNKYYLVELDDSTTLSDLKSKLKAHPSSVGINFVDKTQKETTGGLYTTYTLIGRFYHSPMASSPKIRKSYRCW